MAWTSALAFKRVENCGANELCVLLKILTTITVKGKEIMFQLEVADNQVNAVEFMKNKTLYLDDLRKYFPQCLISLPNQ